MKITIDVSQLQYPGTGVARYTEGLVRALLNKNSGHQFDFVAFTLKNKDYFRNLSFPVKVLPLPPSLVPYLLSGTSINYDFLFDDSDLVHTSDWGEPTTSIRRVTTVHDLVFLLYKETVHPRIRQAQAMRLKKIAANKTHIIADSLSTKSDLIKLCGVHSSLIDVVYPGISSVYKPQKSKEIERVKSKYNIRGSYLLSVGTQEPRKNLQRTIEAFMKLKETQSYRNYSLVLVGNKGWGKELALADSVLSLGYVDDHDLPALYSGASAFVYPSLYEGFGFPVLEAMACGVPVVTSSTSSLMEVAGDVAILVDPTNSVSIMSGIKTALSANDTLCSQGIAWAANFTWDNTADQIISIYEKIGNSL